MIDRVLQELLAPLPVEPFLANHWGRVELHVRGDEDKFAHLFSWQELDWILESQRWETPLLGPGDHPRLRLSHHRETLPLFVPNDQRSKVARLDVASFYRRFREGATLVVNFVDELSRRVRDTAEGLAATFGSHVLTNLYASTGHDPGFGLHWDDHDVFVVQVAGTKEWSLHGPTRKNPLSKRDLVPRPNGEPRRVVTMKAGDCLYLPKGHWHNVHGQDVPSLHLSFNISNATGVNFLRWLVDDLSRDELFRINLPRFGDAQDQERWARALRERLCSRWRDDSIVEEFIRHSDGTLPSRPRFNFGRLYGAASSSGFRLCAQARPVLSRKDQDTIVLCCGGREVAVPRRAERILERLADLEVVSVEQLLAAGDDIGPDELNELLERLLAEGIINAADEPTAAGA
jgi:ribosomal protein L16 Arg81 hydroxylase